jgi:hypothetical protein
MAGFGEAILKALNDSGTMADIDAAISSYVKEIAAKILASEKSDLKSSSPAPDVSAPNAPPAISK